MAEMDAYKDLIPEFVFKLHHILEVLIVGVRKTNTKIS